MRLRKGFEKSRKAGKETLIGQQADRKERLSLEGTGFQ